MLLLSRFALLLSGVAAAIVPKAVFSPNSFEQAILSREVDSQAFNLLEEAKARNISITGPIPGDATPIRMRSRTSLHRNFELDIDNSTVAYIFERDSDASVWVRAQSVIASRFQVSPKGSLIKRQVKGRTFPGIGMFESGKDGWLSSEVIKQPCSTAGIWIPSPALDNKYTVPPEYLESRKFHSISIVGTLHTSQRVDFSTGGGGSVCGEFVFNVTAANDPGCYALTRPVNCFELHNDGWYAGLDQGVVQVIQA